MAKTLKILLGFDEGIKGTVEIRVTGRG